MAYNPLKTFATNLSSLGSALKIPNMGISGTIANQNPQSVVKPSFGLQPMPAFSAKAAAPQQPSNYGQIGPAGGPISFSSTPGPIRGSGSGGGGSTGGQVLGSSNNYSSPPMQSNPQQGGIDYDALIAPALQALDQSNAPAQSSYDASIQGIEQGRLQGKGQLENSLATGQASATQRKGEVTRQSEDAVNESRRQFAEISQGLQARYGGTTGTGAFTEGLAGRQALQNIGQQRQALTGAITQIDNKLEEVRSVTELALQDNEEQAATQKSQAKAQLDNTLNSIRMAKGELLAKKVEYAQQAMQFYQQQVAQVEASNTQFKQQLYQQQQAAQEKLAGAKSRASDSIQKLQYVTYEGKPYGFNPSNGQMTPAQQTSSPYGVGSLDGQDTEDNFIDN